MGLSNSLKLTSRGLASSGPPSLYDGLLYWWSFDEPEVAAWAQERKSEDSLKALEPYAMTVADAGKLRLGRGTSFGAGGYFSTPNGVGSSATDWTWTGWVYAPTVVTDNTSPIRRWPGGGNNEYNFLFYGGELYLQVCANGTDPAEYTSTPFGTGSWRFVCGRYDKAGKKIDLRVDAVDAAQAALASEIYQAGATTMTLGQYIDGMIDEVGFWNRRLTDAEVDAMYNSGNGRFYPHLIGSVPTNYLDELAIDVGDSEAYISITPTLVGASSISPCVIRIYESNSNYYEPIIVFGSETLEHLTPFTTESYPTSGFTYYAKVTHNGHQITSPGATCP